MKIPLNWVQEFTKIEINPKELCNVLSLKLSEVEGFITQKDIYKGIIAVKITGIIKHPRSSELLVTKVDIGRETLQIICGAHNIKKGDIVPLITVGSMVPQTKKIIKTIDIKGEKSQGMLACKTELGLIEDKPGVYILNEDIKIGTPITEILDVGNTIIEIENKALTHRGDCFGVEGISREIAALTEAPFRIPKYKNVTKSSNININVENTNDCPRYVAVKVTGVKIESSPKEIQTRLNDCDVKPINNIVDFTNYAMLETGQPLHAFNAKKLSIKDGKYNLGVRKAKKEENLETLDNVKRDLSTENLVITSHNKPVALAGIIGGRDTEIDENTTEIILEAANFANFTIRKSSRVSGLRTEASLRFEKNLDPNTVDRGIGRFLSLIDKYNAGKVEGICDFYPKKQTPTIIEMTKNFVNKSLGTNLNLDEISNILTSLSFKVEANETYFKVVIPTFRKDISIKEDLLEEIARIYGYERIIPKLPTKDLDPTILDPKLGFLRKIKENLKVLGYSEVYSYSFVGEELYKRAGLDTKNLLEIINPISPQLKFIRNSLLPGLLEKVEFNKNNFNNFKLFEVGKEIHKSLSKTELPKELYALCTAYYSKDQTDLETLYRKAKGDIEEVIKNFNAPKTFKTQIHIKLNLIMYEINLEELFLESLKHKKEIKEIPLFPPIIENISFYLKKEGRVGNIIEKIKELSSLIAEIEVEDIYITDGERSITLKVKYQDPKKSLSDQITSPVREKIIRLLEKDLDLKVRKSKFLTRRVKNLDLSGRVC